MKKYSMNCYVYLFFYVYNFTCVKIIYTTLICY